MTQRWIDMGPVNALLHQGCYGTFGSNFRKNDDYIINWLFSLKIRGIQAHNIHS